MLEKSGPKYQVDQRGLFTWLNKYEQFVNVTEFMTTTNITLWVWPKYDSNKPYPLSVSIL